MNFQFDTYVDIDGHEYEVRCDYEYEPPEYNWGAQIQICAAWVEDQGCVLDDLSDAELAQLEMRCWDHYEMMGERKAAMEEDRADAMREERL